MLLSFSNRDLERLYVNEDGPYRKKLPPQMIDRFFECCADITAARDEQDLRSLKSRRYEKVPRECEGCYSMRLNDQFRIIVVPYRDVDSGEAAMEVRDVLDYHR